MEFGIFFHWSYEYFKIYISFLNNYLFQDDDVAVTKKLLDMCLQHYKDFYILPDQATIPTVCSKHNAVYNLKHFILDYEYLVSNYYVFW